MPTDCLVWSDRKFPYLLQNRTWRFRLHRKLLRTGNKICGCGNAGVLTSKLQMDEIIIQAAGLESVEVEDGIQLTKLEIISDLLKTHDGYLVKHGLEPWFVIKRKRRADVAEIFRQKLGNYIDDESCFEALKVTSNRWN